MHAHLVTLPVVLGVAACLLIPSTRLCAAELSADAGVDQYVYVGDKVYFDGAAGKGDIDSYLWDFGDGKTGTGKSTAHTYKDTTGLWTACPPCRGS